MNAKLLERKLEQSGFEPIVAFNGKDAIALAHQHNPDVILLDIVMPEMDGFEVCKQIKESTATEDIPIIFITSKSARDIKIRGLKSGAADYITKPIDLDETLARVNTQLRIRESHRENIELMQRLAESRKQAAVGHVIEGFAHNLNNLLGVVMGYLDLLRASFDNPERLKRSSSQLEIGIKRMVDIVRQLTTIAEFDQIRTSTHNLDVILENAVERFKKENDADAKVSITNLKPDLDFQTNQETLEGVICRLLENAWQSYDRLPAPPEKRTLLINAEVSLNQDQKPILKIEVNDDGAGIPADIRESIFEPFVSTESAVGRGMGLTISRHSIRGLGGDITIEDRSTGGIRAVITLPVNQS